MPPARCRAGGSWGSAGRFGDRFALVTGFTFEAEAQDAHHVALLLFRLIEVDDLDPVGDLSDQPFRLDAETCQLAGGCLGHVEVGLIGNGQPLDLLEAALDRFPVRLTQRWVSVRLQLAVRDDHLTTIGDPVSCISLVRAFPVRGQGEETQVGIRQCSGFDPCTDQVPGGSDRLDQDPGLCLVQAPEIPLLAHHAFVLLGQGLHPSVQIDHPGPDRFVEDRLSVGTGHLPVRDQVLDQFQSVGIVVDQFPFHEDLLVRGFTIG